MHVQHKIRPYAWALLYGVAIAAFSVFVLLDTFAISRVQATAQEADTSNIVAAENELTASGDAGDGKTTDNLEADADADADTEAAAENGGGDSTGTASTPVITDSAYDDGNIRISLSERYEYGTQIYIADIQVSSAEYLKAAFANGVFGRNVKESTSDMAEDNDAVLAVNGDYYGFRDTGYVVRNGVLYRDMPASGTDALVVWGDGSMSSVSQDEASAQELLDSGAWQVFSFGPTLVDGGTVAVGEDDEVGQSMSSNPRTAIGMVSPLHYVVVVSDGRTDESEGLSLYELAQVLQDCGCTYAYNLDGGGSTTLWFNGEVLNNPTGGRAGHGGGERKVSDIVYFG